MAIDKLIGGAYESDYEYDVPCGAGLTIRPDKPQRQFKDKKIQYNQSYHDPYWCTWYGAMTCVANNRDIERTQDDFDWFRLKAKDYWRRDKLWMYTSKAGDMVVDRLNIKYPNQHRVKEAIQTYDDNLYDLFEKWWMLHMSSQINKQYTDTILDWVIEEPRGTKWSGHARSLTYPWREKERTMIVENYVDWLPYNVIDIKDFKKLLEARQFHRQVFIYYPTTNMTEIPYPYMSLEEADKLERQYPSLFTSNFSESVRAWIDASKAWAIEWKYKNYKWIDWVMKMMIDLWTIR